MKKDWEIKKLKDICRVINGRAYSEDEFFKTGKYKVLRVGNFFTNNTWYYSNLELDEDKYCVDGDLLYAWSASFGPKIWHGEKVIYHYHIWKLETNPCLDKTFFYWWLQSSNMINQFSSDLHGATMHHITKNLMESLSVPLPPLEEQKRIVKILDEKFAQLETIKTNAQTNLQNAKDLFQSQLTKAFSNTTWEKKTIGEVCSKKENIKWKNENVSTEYQYIDLSAVDRESKTISDTQIITKESAPSRAQQIVKTGDILFGTTRPTLKRFCLLSDEYDGQICSTGFCVIRPNQKIVSSDWMFYQFYNDEFYKYIEPLQKGANYPAVTDKDILNYNISVPPLPEQKRIVEELDTLSEKVRQLQEIYTKQIANCDELKQSLLQKAFEGEL